MSKGKSPALSIDSFTEMAGRIIDGIPDRFTRDLNGGFNITEDCKKDGDYFIMGEYIADDLMGSVIMLYYGSFAALLEDKGVEQWEGELKETILHELRHHVEIMAGVDYLSEEEKAGLD
ncbi:MAG: hypothetical protein JL50_19580 [Peptococcaceae bacterium BICA1-7]|nr:MAG: hypothetical protein JL50_19580 [Peptococcaceae bacterium BICA1-7]HBV98278.1 hypothetical protein [Desulfotomaculum sp.]